MGRAGPQTGKKECTKAPALETQPTFGASQSLAKGSRGDLGQPADGDITPITARRSGEATSAALKILEVESKLEQELADAKMQKAKATMARLALLKAQTDGSQSGKSRSGQRREPRVASPITAIVFERPVNLGANLEPELSVLIDDDNDGKVNLKQRLDDVALEEHRAREEAMRYQVLRQEMTELVDAAKAADDREAAGRQAVANE